MYRAGFSTKQEPYDKAVREVFAALDRVEQILSRQHYLAGPQITEADIRLYTTLARFDCVYVGHFKVRSASALYCSSLGCQHEGVNICMYIGTLL